MNEIATSRSNEVPSITIASKTELRNPGKGTKAFVDVVIAGRYKVKGIRVVQDSKGSLFLGWPERKEEDGTYTKMFVPVTKEARNEMETMVIAGYKFGKGGLAQ